MNTNPTSVSNKFDEFVVTMEQNHVDIAIVTETWFQEKVPDDPFYISGYLPPMRRDRQGKKGGGVLVYMRDTLANCVRRHKHLEDPDLETIWITVRPRRLPRKYSILIVGAIYHPPKPNPDGPMLQHIHRSLDMLLQKHPDAAIILAGDFNTMDDKYMKRSFKLKQIVKKPTKGKSILDKIYTNISHLYSEPEILPPLGSLPHGHGVVICQPCLTTEHQQQISSVVSRRSDNNSKAYVAHSLQITNWDNLYKTESCLEQFEIFQSTIDIVLDTHMPLQIKKKHNNDKPWITDSFRAMIQKRQWAHSNGNTDLFRFYKARVRNASKFLRKKFYRTKVSDLKVSKPRQWWKQTKQILGLKRQDDASPKFSQPTQQMGIYRHWPVRSTNLTSLLQHICPPWI